MRTLPSGLPLLDLVHELSFTAAQLQAHPLGTAYLKDFEALLAQGQTALGQQVDLTASLARAEAQVSRADDVLNRLLEQTDLTLLQLSNRDRDSPLYRHFFGSQRPSDAKRPILGPQLELMRDWLPTLQAAAQPELKALATPLDAAIQAADAALAALRKAEQEASDFHDLGTCKALIDASNAARKATHGKLGEAVHKNPTANLPADFAEGFFLRETRWTAPNSKELKARISRAEAQLARWKGQLAEQEARALQAERAAREEKAAALRDELAALDSRVAAERARAAALKSQLDQLTPPPPPLSPAPLPSPV